MRGLGFERERPTLYKEESLLIWSIRCCDFELVIRLLEHAGCLACLQHCLVQRVSPFGDLTLSPRGLRVPARVRFSLQYFGGRIEFLFVEELLF